MQPSPEEQSEREFFAGRYERLQSDPARQVEREVLGREVGLNGFTTIEQAEALVDLLELGPDHWLLDVGAGRGWPGSLVAESSGCRLICTDIPLNALAGARRTFADLGLGARSEVVAADVVELPFRSATFDAVAHADVFC